jgi:LacI family transcriptional regulator
LPRIIFLGNSSWTVRKQFSLLDDGLFYESAVMVSWRQYLLFFQDMSNRKSNKSTVPSESTATTLEMVAAQAKVSPSSVSRFLNGTATVSEAKRTAIEAAIKQLNFVSNPMASGLAGGKSRCIGVITQVLDSPFYGEGFLGIEEVLMAENYAPIFVSSHWSEEQEMRCISFLEGRRVDGIIILTACLPDNVLVEVANRTPMVVTDRNLNSDRLISLNFDNYSGAKMATEHLIELGHSRIAFIKGTPSHSDAIERFRGYRAALKTRGIPYDAKLVVQGHFTEGGGEQAVRQLCNSGIKFSSIFAANDQMAYGASFALYQHGLKVPDDISLVGFDNLRTSDFTLPPLTTIKHSIYEIGKISAKAMIQLIGKKVPSTVTPAPELIKRSSTKRFNEATKSPFLR